MPSAKPDKTEIYELRKRRKLFYPEQNLFSPLLPACRSALEGGYITPERALSLASVLEREPRTTSIFPNNVLFRLLRMAFSGWDSETEALLLDFISVLYLGGSPEDRMPVGVKLSASPDGVVSLEPMSLETDSTMVLPPGDIQNFLVALLDRKHPSLANLYEEVFDNHPSDGLPLRDRLISFTGPMQGGGRGKWFEEARKQGAVPADPAFYLDYLFVSDKHFERRAFSSKLCEALTHRRRSGTPLILREQAWHAALGSQ